MKLKELLEIIDESATISLYFSEDTDTMFISQYTNKLQLKDTEYTELEVVSINSYVDTLEIYLRY